MEKKRIVGNIILLTGSMAVARMNFAAPATQPATQPTKQLAPATQPLDPAVSALIKQLGDDDARKRDQAATKLREMGTTALPALAQAMNADDAQIRITAEDLLNDIKNPRKPEEKPPVADAGQLGMQDGIVLGANGQIIINGRANGMNGQLNGARIRVFQGQLNLANVGVNGMQIKVQTRNENGVQTTTREITSNNNGEKVHILQENDSIKMEITKGEKTDKYEAKNEADLKEKNAEAFKVYKQFIGN